MSDLIAADQPLRPILDHAVINVMDRLDQAAAQYVRLGFQLTERGHHTLGSSNNLAIIVFKSTGADLVYSTLKKRAVPVQEPMSFARPVALPDGPQDARFKVVRVSGDEVQNGRTFFCHHDTPELVYRPEWQVHPNGVTDIVEFVIASHEPVRTAAVYDRMFGPDLLTPVPGGVSFRAGPATVRVLEPAAIADRYAGAALVSEDGSDRMVALTFKVASLATPRALFDTAGIAYRPFAGGIVVSHADAANVALGFSAS